MSLTHFNEQGDAHMVDVGDKSPSQRRAIARGMICMQPATLELVISGQAKKGDVLAVARLAAIQATKKTADLIPLCHPLALTHIDVKFLIHSPTATVECQVCAETFGRTGVEMEALTGVQIGLLTIYDMLKATDKTMVINGVTLLEKSGGRSGNWRNDSLS